MTNEEQKAVYMNLQPSEMAIFRAAADIFAGYAAAGQVTEENSADMQMRAIREAIRMAQIVEKSIDSDNEMRSTF